MITSSASEIWGTGRASLSDGEGIDPTAAPAGVERWLAANPTPGAADHRDARERS